MIQEEGEPAVTPLDVALSGGFLGLAAIIAYLRTFTGFGRDARLFLLTTVVFGAALSVYWADFNLYLETLGLDLPTIGLLMAVSQLAGVVVSLPAAMIADRIGRRVVIAAGIALVVLATIAFLPGNVTLICVGAVAMGAGPQVTFAVEAAYIADHTRPDERNEYFSLLQAAGFASTFFATLVGGIAASELSSRLNLGTGPAPYRLLLVATILLSCLALATTWFLPSDRLARQRITHVGRRFGIVLADRTFFFRLLLPAFLMALGGGQLIPFLNVFIETKFHLDLPAVNFVLGVASIGTVLALLAQPALATRFGRIRSIVLVQGASIPLLLILGFSPFFWTVVFAMTVRDALMNAGGPILDAFAMGRVSEAERGTLSAALVFVFSLGWLIGPLYYGLMQWALGFTAGYAASFTTIIGLYSAATFLLWTWFRDDDVDREQAPYAGLAGEPKPTEESCA
jgi:MFS family permease